MDLTTACGENPRDSKQYFGKMSIIGNKVLVPYPGTPLFDYPEQFGIFIRHKDWSKYLRHFKPVYDLRSLTAEKLFEWLMIQDHLLLDSYCHVLGIQIADLENIIPNNYLYRQFFNSQFQGQKR